MTKNYKRMCNLLLIMLLLAAQVTDVYAQAPGEEKKVTESEVHDVTEEVPNSYDEDLEVELEVYESDNGYVKAIFAPGEKNTAYVPYTCQIYTTKKMELTVNSSNENVVKGKNTVLETYEPGYCFESGTLGVEICGVGYCTLTFSLGNVTKTMDVCVVPQSVEITKIQQTDAQKAMISWKKVSGCSGYILERSEDEYGDYKEISRTTGSQSTATVISEWDKNYYYRVIGYVKAGDKTENNDYYSRYTKSKSFVITKPTAVLKSVEQKGKSSLKVTWEKMGYATGYELYQKEGLSKAKCIYKGNKTSFKKKITKGKQYTFYVIARYSKKASKKSNSIMAYLPKSGKVVGTRQESVEQIDMQEGQYQWYSADSDEIFYYTANDKMYMVVRQEQKLYIYQMDAKNKYKPFKIIDLGKLDYWGGFYHGTDGKFYVAVGFDNMKENDKKTVIKVYQYSSKWKKMKTCNIKGNATNKFKGICTPFRASGCSMEMAGNTLCLSTGRLMYAIDNVNHQSNIAFKINTKTMKYQEKNEVYVSHSFQQIVKYKDGVLYQVDHGDAYPRAISLTIAKDFEEKSNDKEYYSSFDKEYIKNREIFKFKGDAGNNTTGATVGGMEVGNKNNIICGTSQPHYSKVKGVSGFGSNYKSNVYVVVADKKTGKSSIKWLTKYHPLKTNNIVGETRLVKISDTRFAVLYSVLCQGNEDFHMDIIDDAGKIVKRKKYTDVTFKANSQPILYQGNICWTVAKQENNSSVIMSYQIPVEY